VKVFRSQVAVPREALGSSADVVAVKVVDGDAVAVSVIFGVEEIVGEEAGATVADADTTVADAGKVPVGAGAEGLTGKG